MTIAPKPPFDSGDMLTALCVWREARNQSIEAKTGVVWVLMNRAHVSPSQGFPRTIAENILKPWQFSSFNKGDPNCELYPEESDPSWVESQRAVAAPGLVDPTSGSVFYYSEPVLTPPAGWGKVEIAAIIDELTFCRPIPENFQKQISFRFAS